MSDLEWQQENLPVSKRFDDPYFSRADGRAETGHVFINGNQLPGRWQTMKHCTIAELGFGTGLNFLETVYQWQSVATSGQQLNFISFEQFPITGQEMSRALANWPELSPLATRLVGLWAPNEDELDCEFADNVHLKVCFGDANKLLTAMKFAADAWFLDGFSPAKNPELWNEILMDLVAKNTCPGGTFATYTAAGFVRRGLQAAGFDVDKIKGFGTKRDMLVGKLPGDIHVADGT